MRLAPRADRPGRTRGGSGAPTQSASEVARRAGTHGALRDSRLIEGEGEPARNGVSTVAAQLR